MNRDEAIKRAAELKVILVKMNTPEAETNLYTWQCHFSKYPMRSRNDPQGGLVGFIEYAEEKIAHYKAVLREVD